MKSKKSARWVVATGALATCALIAGPFTGSASAGITTTTVKTSLVAHSIVVDVTTGNLQANVPLRPSAHLYAKTGSGKVPLANQVVQFFAAGQDLCAEKTNTLGYTECNGGVRLTWSLLALGRYEAVHPETVVGSTTYSKSTDTGQLLTVGSLELI